MLQAYYPLGRRGFLQQDEAGWYLAILGESRRHKDIRVPLHGFNPPPKQLELDLAAMKALDQEHIDALCLIACRILTRPEDHPEIAKLAHHFSSKQVEKIILAFPRDRSIGKQRKRLPEESTLLALASNLSQLKTFRELVQTLAGGSKQRILSVRIPTKLYNQLKAKAKSKNMSLSQFVTQILAKEMGIAP